MNHTLVSCNTKYKWTFSSLLEEFLLPNTAFIQDIIHTTGRLVTHFFISFQSSRDLVCFVQFDNLNVYYGKDFKSKYKALTDFCFVLKVRRR